MRVSMKWLEEFVAVDAAPRALGAKLTLAGLELEALEQVVPAFSSVVVARIVACDKHPDADKLSVCRVDAGDGQQRQIVCGAPNARTGLVAPLALLGARIGTTTIKVGKLRGVESQGMLCSARELGLGDDQDGLLELPADLVLGTPLERALALDDAVLELAITPNRGDCLSMLGVAREAAAVTGKALCTPVVAVVAARGTATLKVDLQAAADCPVFAGRLVQGIRRDARSRPSDASSSPRWRTANRGRPVAVIARWPVCVCST